MPFARYLKNLIFTLFTGALFSVNALEAANSETETYQYDLSIAAIFQNEAPYLREWIEFHKLVGVQHFYLYNNLSSDDFLTVLAPYLQNGEVELSDWEYDCKTNATLNWNYVQIDAYADALSKAIGRTKWLAVIDLDEFLIPVQEPDLIKFLSDYEDAVIGGVRANWQMYGTSYVSKLPSDSLMIEKLLLKAPKNLKENRYVKTIIRPERIKKLGIHAPTLLKGYIAVNSDKKPSRRVHQEIIVDKIRINHYWLRDEDFCFNIKIPRLKSATKWKSEEQVLKMLDSLNQEHDDIMLRFVPELREKMRFY